MPRMNFDPNKVSSGIPLLDAGDYQFLITDAQLFFRLSEQTDEQGNKVTKEVYGTRYPVKILSAPPGSEHFIGKSIPISLYMHTEGGDSMNKAFVMAAYGFTQKDEMEFNEQYPAGDGWINSWASPNEPDSADLLADVWKGVAQRKVNAVVTVGQRKGTNDKQNNFRWSPYTD